MGSSRPGKRRRRLWFLLYPFYLMLWVVAVHYFVFWRPFQAKMRARRAPHAELQVPAHVDKLTMRRLGAFNPSRRSSFVNFSEAKADGMTRVCAFGDSFTYGEEVADGHDYPAQLQKLLRDAGFDRVEVLNFGSSWYGFHQTYVLWDAVGRRFGCDYVLLGPSSFQYHRDTMFNHTYYHSPYYLHARYVLDGDDVRLLDVFGNTYAERFADYFRFLPRWQYLRYDRNVMPTLAAVISENATLPNPLYYFPGDMETEALLTYERLLHKLANDGPQVVLLHHNKRLIEMTKRLGLPNLVAAASFVPKRFLYHSPAGHYSAFGNQLIAREFLHQLVDRPEERLSIVEINDLPDVAVSATKNRPRPLSTYARVEIRAGKHPVAYLAPTADTYGVGPGSAAILNERKVVGLLALRDGKTSLIDAKYAEINFILHPGDKVVLRATGDKAKRLRLGRVRMLDPAVNVGVIDLAELNTVGFTFVIGPKGLNPESIAADGTAVELWVGDHTALRGKVVARSIHVKPLKGESRHFRVSTGQFTDLKASDAVPQFDLVLQDGKSTTRVPIATWKRAHVPMPHADPHLPQRLMK